MQFSLGSSYPLVLGYKCNPKHPVFWHNLYAYLDIRNQIPLPTFSLFENVIWITDNTYSFCDFVPRSTDFLCIVRVKFQTRIEINYWCSTDCFLSSVGT
jgi:hypothetical protein